MFTSLIWLTETVPSMSWSTPGMVLNRTPATLHTSKMVRMVLPEAEGMATMTSSTW